MASVTNEKSSKDIIYELTYKAGHIMNRLYFSTSRGLDKAIELGKQYCDSRGLRFIQVYEWLKDIEGALKNKEEDVN